MGKFDTNAQKQILNMMVTISRDHREILSKHRALFEQLSSNPFLRSMCENAINFLEGRRYTETN